MGIKKKDPDLRESGKNRYRSLSKDRLGGLSLNKDLPRSSSKGRSQNKHRSRSSDHNQKGKNDQLLNETYHSLDDKIFLKDNEDDDGGAAASRKGMLSPAERREQRRRNRREQKDKLMGDTHHSLDEEFLASFRDDVEDDYDYDGGSASFEEQSLESEKL